MPQIIRDTEGKEHTVHTQEEIDAMVSDKLKEKDGAIAKMQSELEELKKDDGKRDWASTRQQIKDLEVKLEQSKKDREAEKEQFSGEIRNVRTSLFQTTVDAMVDGLAVGDAELSKKIRFHYERLGGDVKNEKEASEKMKDAYLLATGKQSPNPLNVARGFSGEAPKVSETASAAVAELGRKFGVTADDLKKYGQKAQEKKQSNY